MLIDLHCHTNSLKNGGEQRNISVEKMMPILEEKGVRIVSITNHNSFNIDEFNEAYLLGEKKDIQFYPGVEVDVLGIEEERAHIIIVVDPKQSSHLDTLFGNSAIENPDSYSISLVDLIDKIRDMDYLFIVHYGKSPDLGKKSLEYAKKNVEKHRLFLEPSNYRSLSIHSNKGHSCIVGSDIKDWSKYLDSSNVLPELKFDVKSFKEFVLLAKRDKDIVQTLLNRTTTTKLNINLKIDGSKNPFRTEEIVLYDDLNIIFGGKGSGKSKYLKFISESLRELGKTFTYYDSEEAKSILEKYRKVKQDEHSVEALAYGEINCDFSAIREWKETKPTAITLYREAVDTNRNKRNRKYLSIVEVTNLKNAYESELPIFEANYKKIRDFESWMTQNDLEYLFTEDSIKMKESIINILAYLKYKSFEKYKEYWIDSQAIELANKSIGIIKTETDLLSNGRSIPSEAGLESMFLNIVKPYKELVTFSKFGKLNSKEEKHKFGDLEENKPLYLITSYSPLNSGIKSKEYSFKNHKITELNRVSETFKNALESFLTDEFNGKLVEATESIKENKINDLSDFVCISRRYSTENQDYYIPSSGEEKVIAFQKALEEESQYYLLDEPEKSLGSLYTSTVILSQIKRLSKLRKCVVCTTHSANIAVLGMPLQSFLKEYNNRVYETYSGNMFTNELVSLSNPVNSCSWSETSVNLLEGGKYAFDERSYAYGIK
ncbi:hypothetical protein [Erysipelothrix rhusiopathiae]|uniref:PHP domain-containing protein n=1 Tax=Erysipelothrix rhusiopathiae TaxID=1648 RepID=UPI0023B08E9D|nr:hypothetical protein [Erysipelothrix rhusiopathiae]MDE8041750.1 hypothetical protein [Erysipelothrix rhusiopathiae]MDE8049230.1 hypothetical protein [Erysipelothrix rhusiopathiae]MDE8057884.1 hypothetical protein [Erysipelothrix rhusiopathiae]MDE8066659.1 hypothetical protein [Erysipelothrix rhusiopathiae]